MFLCVSSMWIIIIIIIILLSIIRCLVFCAGFEHMFPVFSHSLLQAIWYFSCALLRSGRKMHWEDDEHRCSAEKAKSTVTKAKINKRMNENEPCVSDGERNFILLNKFHCLVPSKTKDERKICFVIIKWARDLNLLREKSERQWGHSHAHRNATRMKEYTMDQQCTN